VGSEEVPEINIGELEIALHQMKNLKCPGEVQITCEMIKIGSETLMEHVRLLLNECLTEGKIPTKWQNAEVILLYKKRDRNNIDNYRLIIALIQTIYENNNQPVDE